MARPDDRSLSVLLTCTGLAAAAYAAPALAAPIPMVRPIFGVADRVRGTRGVALTFDDGPHAEGTPAVLDVLERRGVRATFFLVGEQVQRNPDVARRLAEAGHGVALHCQRHRNLLRLSPAQVREDLKRATEVIVHATGRRPTLYRPPYGVLNLAALGWARREALRPLLWTRWGRDWEARATPASIVRAITGGVAERDVLLLHDADDYASAGSWRRTLASLEPVLDELERRGLELVDP